MRTLKFVIENQTIKLDPKCDFSGMVPGSKGYLRAEFDFDHNWANCEKMAVFIPQDKREQIPVRLKDGSCLIPTEALYRRSYRVYVVGVAPNLRIVTNKLEVKQDG